MTVWCKKCGNKRATYKERGRGKPLLYCVKCKKQGMIKIGGIVCQEEDCEKTSIFNHFGEKRGKFCVKHKEPGMVDVKNVKKLCKFPECRTRASFNFPGQTSGMFCSEHKKSGMIPVSFKMCEHPGCFKYPTFNFENEPKSKFCAEHKEPGMENVKGKKCEHQGCKKLPVFNFEGEIKKRFCNEHKEPGMINVKDKKCEYSGCKITPIFNNPGETKGAFCDEHKKLGMVDVENKRCSHPGCGKRPSFNFKGITKDCVCAEHRKPNMIDVKNKVCEFGECRKQPIFNFKGQNRGIFCHDHKKPNMINVVDKICNYKGCKTTVSYGLLFSTGTKCYKHKTANMFSKRQLNPMCQHSFDDLCPNRPFYAPPDTNYPTHCEKHSPEGYINIIEKKCEKCKDLYYIPDNQTKCEICLGARNLKKIVKAKELRIKSVLECHEIELVSYDKIPEGSCSKKRPDFVIKHPYFPIVIEVDESQHKSYPGVCDVTRMIQLHQDFGENLVFIRYNPDSYTNQTGKIQKGFQQNSKRELRLITLIKQLLRKEETDHPLSAYYLFYDGDDGVDKVIDIDYDNYFADYRPLVKKLENERKGISEEIEE